MNQRIARPLGKIQIKVRNTLKVFGWPIFLFILAFCLYVICYRYQSLAIVRDTPLLYHEKLSPPSKDFVLEIIYPQKLQPAHYQDGNSVIELYMTSTITSTPTYTVSLDLGSDSTILIDNSGKRVGSQFVFTPTTQGFSTMELHIQRIMTCTEGTLLWPRLSVSSSTGQETIPTNPPPAIELLSLSSISKARFWSSILGSTTPLIPAAAGLIVLAIKIFQEKEKRFQDIKQAFTEINQCEKTLRVNLSEGARQYADDLRNRKDANGIWRTAEVQAELTRIWGQTPYEFRKAMKVLRLSDEELQEKIPLSDVDALKWMRATMDQTWQRRAFSELLALGHAETENERFFSILRIWPHISFWRDTLLRSKYTTCEIDTALKYLGLEKHPFADCGPAEESSVWFNQSVDAEWLSILEEPQATWAIGPTGCGKTAAALHMMHDNFNKMGFFPVYYPVSRIPTQQDLYDISRTLANILLRYLALAPAEFLQQNWSTKSAIVHLWIHCIDADLQSWLYEVGLTPIDDGLRMLEEIENLRPREPLHKPLAADKLLQYLAEARPRDYAHTAILIDVQKNTAASETFVNALLHLNETLSRAGVLSKVFLPQSFELILKRVELPSRIVKQPLIWSDTELATLLSRWMQRDASIDAWCDRRQGNLNAQSRLVHAAQGTPLGLLLKGNELLRVIGKKNAKLTEEDLDHVLGPLPDGKP